LVCVLMCVLLCVLLCDFFLIASNIHHSSGDRTCGCRSVAFAAVQTQNKKVIELCENYLNFVGIQNGLQVAAVMSVIVVNIAYVVVAKKLGAYESHASLDGQYRFTGCCSFFESSCMLRLHISLSPVTLFLVSSRSRIQCCNRGVAGFCIEHRFGDVVGKRQSGERQCNLQHQQFDPQWWH
jgi:hypothetical protein